MRDTALYKNEDLVLQVSSNVDPAKFDMGRYEAFIEALSEVREYQKEALRTICNYLLGGAHRNQRELAQESFALNQKLREKYVDFHRLETVLQFPDRLACSMDMATGTGKSYVMYGLARILLACGAVTRVLVLCPSNTIERGLTDKFLALSKRGELTDLLPDGAKHRTAHIIHATETVRVGDVCIENIHATYRRTKSAIDDSFKGNGERTLVLCDEAHHMFSPEGDAALRRWKEFLIDPAFGFRYVVGFSGTCYVQDEYFTDVVYRYSLRQAIEDGVVKTIEYVAEDSSGDQSEKFQKIYANHRENKTKYRRVKPLTVMVTKDIAACKKLEDDLVAFLAKKEGVPKAEAAAKVMRVHSRRTSGLGAKEDAAIAANVERLRAGEPDRKDSPIEWIVSVSMLTEGWDAHNVFQIVPHEERAFNSKLLVAQVLGRGLRIPAEYRGERPVVTVFNHDQWSPKIKHLVEEVLEIERRVYAAPIKKDPSYDFVLHDIDYGKTEDVVEAKKESEYNFDMEYVTLAAQRKSVDESTTYERVLTSERRTKRTRVQLDMIDLERVATDVHNRFKAIDLETGSTYAKRYTRARIRGLIRASLDQIDYRGDEVSKENRQRILSAFGNLRRPGSKSIRYKITATSLVRRRASERPKDSVSLSALLRPGGARLFYDDLSKKSDPVLRQILEDLEKDDTRPVSALTRVKNKFHFRTCLSVAVAQSTPERKFIAQLIEPENAVAITAWLKSTDVGFYGIEFSYPRGDFSKRGMFNPDFFLVLGKADVLVVEIKEDEEIGKCSSENQGKRRAAVEHFTRLNALQKEARYHFCFLTPKDYEVFFAELLEGRAMKFQSALDAALDGQRNQTEAQ